MEILVQILVSIGAVAVGGLVTYVVNVRDRRAQHIEGLFNAAIADIASAAAAMQYINNVPPEVTLPPEQAARLEATLVEAGYKRFVELVAQARASLAQVVPYRDDLRPHLSSIAGVIESADIIIAELRKGPRE